LAGFQTGGDVWIGLMQGLHWGRGQGRSLQQPLHARQHHHHDALGHHAAHALERFADNEAAFITEASIDLVADILPSWSIRGGYEILFLNSIVLAGDNFNTASPYGLPNQTPRAVCRRARPEFYHASTSVWNISGKSSNRRVLGRVSLTHHSMWVSFN
jgi:hypothetical protein